MPVCEGLFLPVDLDSFIQDLLYMLATWHAYAKCRMHTQTSLDMLEATTQTLGHLIRVFKRKTAEMDTREIPKETEARKRRQAKKSGSKAKTSPLGTRVNRGGLVSEDVQAQPKVFNLETYKLHALGAYVRAILTFGTVDNYSTQVVSISLLYLKI